MIDLLIETSWCIPLYGLMGALLTLPWSTGLIKRTGPRPAAYFNLLMTLLAFVHGGILLRIMLNHDPYEIVIHWLKAADLDLYFTFDISAVSVGAMQVITGLSLLAQVYALGYMEKDWAFARFFALMGFFEASMSGLAISNSLLLSYCLLEILTLSTYLLVGFWYAQPLVVTAARDAFLTKRVGDVLLLMGVICLATQANSLDFNQLYDWAETANLTPTTATLLGLALIAGPTGKCAQFPLHLWLDEAMEGPLPSTILRNSVVVATGAWVLVKVLPILSLSPGVLTFTIIIGSITALGGSLISIAQIDIKRSLSYLVSAYMGLVFIAIGTQQPKAALLLVLVHAVAMALLVTNTGGIISNVITQDLTQLGGLWSRRPISGIAFLVGAAGLIALPPLGGFWALLELVNGLWNSHPLLVALLLVINAIAAFALVRIFGLIFAGNAKQMTQRSQEVLWPMVMPMMLLVGLTLHLPLIMQKVELLPAWDNLNKDLALLLTWSSLFGISLGVVVYVGNWGQSLRGVWKPLQDLLAYDFYTAKIYGLIVILPVAVISKIISWIDNYLVDGVVNFVGLATLFSGQSLRYNVSGQSQSYLLTIILGITLFLGLLSFSSFDVVIKLIHP